MIGDWRLEEEAQVAEDGAELRTFNLKSGEELAKHNHVVHERHGEERVFADVIAGDSVGAAHENLGGVLIKSTLAVADERHILDDDLVVNVVTGLTGVLGASRRVKDGVALDGVVENTSL